MVFELLKPIGILFETSIKVLKKGDQKINDLHISDAERICSAAQAFMNSSTWPYRVSGSTSMPGSPILTALFGRDSVSDSVSHSIRRCYVWTAILRVAF